MSGRLSPRPGLDLTEGYHSPQVEVKNRLNTNESPYPPPEEFTQRLAQAVAGIEFNRYPDRGVLGLRSQLAEHHGVLPSQIFVANGSNEVLQSLFLAFGGPSRRVAVFEPTYALHSHIARVTSTEVEVGERDDRFAIPDAELARVVGTGAELVFFCSPNNPTGRVEDRDQVRSVVGAANQLVVVDEAYVQFADQDFFELFDEGSNVVLVRTFSKTLSFAAGRLGYCIAPSWVVAGLESVVLPYHLDSLKQAAAALLLEYLDEMVLRARSIVEQRKWLESSLDSLGLLRVDSSANFVLFNPGTDADLVWGELVARSVLVRNCSSWPRLQGWLRVTVGTVEENTAFIEALSEIIDAMGETT